MPHTFKPSVIVGHDPSVDCLVFLTEGGGWTPTLAEAEIIDDEAHGDIRLLDAEIGARGLSGIRLAKVELGPRGATAIKESAPLNA